MEFNAKLLNVIQLSVGFMLIFTAFHNASYIQQIIVETDVNDTISQNISLGGLTHDSGYISSSILYWFFTFANFLAPPLIGIFGPKIMMVVGACMYVLYMGIYLKLLGWVLYLTSVTIGFGAAFLWTAQGTYLAQNSSKATMARNSGLFWACLQCSFLIGSMFLYFEFKGQATITKQTQEVVYIVFTVLAAAGTLVLLLLRKPPSEEQLVRNSTRELMKLAGREFVLTFKLLARLDFALLTLVFCYTGLSQSFILGVYGTCVGNTKYFTSDANALLGLTGIAIGVGEILGGATFGLFGKYTIKFTRIPIIALGLIVQIVAFILVLLNTPLISPLQPTSDLGFIHPSQGLAIFISFLLGLGDSCWNTQVYSIIGTLLGDDAAPGFALFKFSQSLMTAIAFYYTTVAQLHWQLLVLVIAVVVAAGAFTFIEWTLIRNTRKVDITKDEELTKYPNWSREP